jgi:hypothetical protein
MLISDLAPFGSFRVAVGPVIQHSTVPNTYAHCRPRQTPQAFAGLRTALWAAGTAARRRQRVQGIRRQGNNPSHIGASNPPISAAASLSSEVTISTLRATCQGSGLLADASSLTSNLLRPGAYAYAMPIPLGWRQHLHGSACRRTAVVLRANGA